MSYEANVREDGIVELSFVGNMDVDGLEAYERDFLLPHFATVPDDKKVNVLYSADREGRFTIAARKKLNEINENPKLGKLAVMEGSWVSQTLVGMLMKISGKKTFDLLGLRKRLSLGLPK